MTGAALRPELFPTSVSKTRRRAPTKSVRTRAAVPDHVFDVPTELPPEGEPLSDELHQALLAAVCVPHPVFTSDLEVLAGSKELIMTWEDQCRSSSSSKVRFIGARQRHGEKGALVLPADDLRKDSPDLARSYWSECIERYRGPQLYEIAVLLQSVSKDVVSCHPSEHTMTLRLLGRSGASSAHGIVVVLGSKLAEDGPTREALAKELEEILNERLSRVTVLTTKMETYDAMTRAVAEEAVARKWGPTMPVLGARSWDYAAAPDAVNQQLLRG